MRWRSQPGRSADSFARSHECEFPRYWQFLNGKFLRICPLQNHFILAVCDGTPPSVDEQVPTGCISCPYRACNCPMMEKRMRKEKSIPKKR